ncbi:hypothetical protein LCGC14_1318260 [marine sediment metagenome]|uniref:Uncharacterized protein n=1 Tax=marine sediment metagenome TaxID=412755 RepID=A0A0F9KK98_9ZZZZ
MYTSYPNRTEINLGVGTEPGSVKVEINLQPANVPDKCRVFIEKLGWMQQINHPDTGEKLFHKPPPTDASDEEKGKWNYELVQGYWHWYEAVAYEFSKFMGIEEDTGGTSSGSDTMGAQAAQAPSHP